MKKIVHETTDSFDERLDVLAGIACTAAGDRCGGQAVYERLRTAQSICAGVRAGCLFRDRGDLALLQAISGEIARARRCRTSKRERRRSGAARLSDDDSCRAA